MIGPNLTLPALRNLQKYNGPGASCGFQLYGTNMLKIWPTKIIFGFYQ
jgi:hypothetical protein